MLRLGWIKPVLKPFLAVKPSLIGRIFYSAVTKDLILFKDLTSFDYELNWLESSLKDSNAAEKLSNDQFRLALAFLKSIVWLLCVFRVRRPG